MLLMKAPDCDAIQSLFYFDKRVAKRPDSLQSIPTVQKVGVVSVQQRKQQRISDFSGLQRDHLYYGFSLRDHLL